MVKVISKINNK